MFSRVCGCVFWHLIFLLPIFLSWTWHCINECLSEIIQAHFESRFFHFGDDFLSESKFTQILSGLLVLVLLLLIFLIEWIKRCRKKRKRAGVGTLLFFPTLFYSYIGFLSIYVNGSITFCEVPFSILSLLLFGFSVPLCQYLYMAFV